ncbi:response regulator transcription factor [Roseobacter sp. AzwK-3b]|uniref:response regulator transcription factor n=1 Tax=Roseobacter sp. AzwK-3b TaxID=351016 RepID=UPI000682657D|nr:response regulator transcription factor [Roseobacter sp. AzwK-3b]
MSENQTGTTVLVVEDERDVRACLRTGLQDRGFDVLEAESRDSALDMIRRNPVDLVTLDLCLGADDGLELARELREARNVPIIIVTALAAPQDRVRGLENGADDYITKPFHLSEVVMRMTKVLRRYELEASASADSGPDLPHLLDFDHCVFDTRRRFVRKLDGRPIDLTDTELRLLELFVRHPGRVLSRDEISLALRGQAWSPLDRTIDGHVARLRRKIDPGHDEPLLIRSVRGVGYVFTGEVCPETDPDDPVPGAMPAQDR